MNWSAADGVEATAPYIDRSALSGLSVSRQLRARHVAVTYQSLTPLPFVSSSALVTSMSMGVTIDFVGAASGGGETAETAKHMLLYMFSRLNYVSRLTVH